jgi:hypothetical protein
MSMGIDPNNSENAKIRLREASPGRALEKALKSLITAGDLTVSKAGEIMSMYDEASVETLVEMATCEEARPLRDNLVQIETDVKNYNNVEDHWRIDGTTRIRVQAKKLLKSHGASRDDISDVLEGGSCRSFIDIASSQEDDGS